jgi:hypothetical protein
VHTEDVEPFLQATATEQSLNQDPTLQIPVEIRSDSWIWRSIRSKTLEPRSEKLTELHFFTHKNCYKIEMEERIQARIFMLD